MMSFAFGAPEEYRWAKNGRVDADRQDVKKEEKSAMRIIGITGGVGAGKSLVLEYLERQHGAYVLYADRVANDLKLPGQPCYGELVKLLGSGVLAPDQTIDRAKMAAMIFADAVLLGKVNAVLHPAVRSFILAQIEQKRRERATEVFVIEAALLIEEHYDEICDELWYIYADPSVRRRRLEESRGYSRERIDGIMDRQLSDEEFRRHCRIVIDNSGQAADTYIQIDQKLGADQCQI